MPRRNSLLQWFYKGKQLIPSRVGALVVALVLIGALLMQLQSAGYLKSQVDGDMMGAPQQSGEPVSCNNHDDCPSGFFCDGTGQCQVAGCDVQNPCPLNYYCDYTTLSCVYLKAEGSECDGSNLTGNECAYGYTCLNEYEMEAGQILPPFGALYWNDPKAKSYCQILPTPMEPTPV